MRRYDYTTVWKELLTPEIVSMLSRIHEYKGEQNLFIEANKDVLTQLLEIAKIQSVESSNKIEGIYTSDERIKKLLTNKVMPKNRSEEEIAGYRDVLATIHENYDFIPVKPAIILQLHRDMYKFSGKGVGGIYKVSNNVIEEEDGEGNKFVRFQPVEAWETPLAIEQLCKAYDEAVNDKSLDPLLVIPMFVLDFLSIHPFKDGNGRMSRLLTLLLLYRAGYIVGKYISIEKLIEVSKETYYDSLKDSSQNWHENKNSYIPFVRYTLGVILAAYREFESRVQTVITSGLSKPERVAEVIKNTFGKITKTEIMEKCPDISQITIQRTLIDLTNKGKIIKIGGGRYSSYTWNREK